jgi:hypothetical protein
MSLNYLVFDFSEDTEGIGTFDAMASTSPAQVSAVRSEIAQVLDWAHATFPGARCALGEGAEWDYDLQAMQEVTSVETLEYDERERSFRVKVGPAGVPRHTVTLSVSGSQAFCDAFRERFMRDDG